MGDRISDLKSRKQGGVEYKLSYIKQVNPQSCIGCGSCIKVCGEGVFRLINTPQGFKSKVVFPKRCLGEGHCLQKCPTQALLFN